MYLAPWSLVFNPRVTATPVWVRLTHLPLIVWYDRALRDIGNKRNQCHIYGHFAEQQKCLPPIFKKGQNRHQNSRYKESQCSQNPHEKPPKLNHNRLEVLEILEVERELETIVPVEAQDEKKGGRRGKR